jgi:hypothetical protein
MGRLVDRREIVSNPENAAQLFRVTHAAVDPNNASTANNTLFVLKLIICSNCLLLKLRPAIFVITLARSILQRNGHRWRARGVPPLFFSETLLC